MNVLYVCTDWNQLYGSSCSLLNILNGLKGSEYHPVVLICREGIVSEHFRSLGYEVLVHPFFFVSQRAYPLLSILHRPSRIRFWQYFHGDKECTRYVVRQLTGRKIDVVHSNSSIATIGSNLAKALNAKHIWHVREFLDKDFHLNVFLGKRRLRSIIDTADLRICISKAVAAHWNFKGDTKIIYNAIRKSGDAVYYPDKERYILFCAGNVSSLKGADFALRAFALSGIWKRGYSIMFVGDCTDVYKAELLTIARQYGVAEEILAFKGHQTDVKPFFERASAFLMCSPNEALGRVTIEAMFYGCLVIGRNTGGTPEIIRQAETGYLFSTEEDCARILEKIPDKDNSHLILNAQDFAKSVFSEEVYCPQIKRLYDSLACGK